MEVTLLVPKINKNLSFLVIVTNNNNFVSSVCISFPPELSVTARVGTHLEGLVFALSDAKPQTKCDFLHCSPVFTLLAQLIYNLTRGVIQLIASPRVAESKIARRKDNRGESSVSLCATDFIVICAAQNVLDGKAA